LPKYLFLFTHLDKSVAHRNCSIVGVDRETLTHTYCTLIALT